MASEGVLRESAPVDHLVQAAQFEDGELVSDQPRRIDRRRIAATEIVDGEGDDLGVVEREYPGICHRYRLCAGGEALERHHCVVSHRQDPAAVVALGIIEHCHLVELHAVESGFVVECTTCGVGETLTGMQERPG